MSKRRHSILALTCFLVGCSSAETLTEDGKKNLTEQIAQLEISEVSDPKGNTSTEELLYLLKLPTLTKSATLIVMDGQLETLEATGRLKEANELRNSRQLLLQAMDENMPSYIESAARVYEKNFTSEELARMIEIHKDPVMKKATDSQLEIQQQIIPIADDWAEQVNARYQELLSKK